MNVTVCSKFDVRVWVEICRNERSPMRQLPVLLLKRRQKFLAPVCVNKIFVRSVPILLVLGAAKLSSSDK